MSQQERGRERERERKKERESNGGGIPLDHTRHIKTVADRLAECACREARRHARLVITSANLHSFVLHLYSLSSNVYSKSATAVKAGRRSASLSPPLPRSPCLLPPSPSLSLPPQSTTTISLSLSRLGFLSLSRLRPGPLCWWGSGVQPFVCKITSHALPTPITLPYTYNPLARACAGVS